MYVQGSLVEIQTPTHWNLIGRSMNRPASCVVCQQYSSTTFIFISLRFHSRKEKFGACSKNVISFFTFLKIV
jgi:hypothetical protein